MANYVLVHDAWRGGWVWERVTKRLRKARHSVYARSLTGLAERCHLLTLGVTLDTHVQDMTDNVLICGDSSLTAICFSWQPGCFVGARCAGLEDKRVQLDATSSV
jgi:hypothetical protein